MESHRRVELWGEHCTTVPVEKHYSSSALVYRPRLKGRGGFRTEPEAQDAPTSLHASVDVGVAAANTPTSDGDAGA